MKKVLAIAALSIVAFSSCRKHYIKGEGAVITETRNISNHYTIQSDGEADVQVLPSNTNKVVVSGYQNLVPAFETNVSGSKLTLKFKDKFYNVRNNNIKVTVYSTDVNMVRINGSGNMSIGDSIRSKTMQAEINGSGNMYFGSNAFDKLELRVVGSGDINAERAVGKYVDAYISGSGNIHTTATESLNIKISGSGDVIYKGNPNMVSVDISGSGKAKKY